MDLNLFARFRSFLHGTAKSRFARDVAIVASGAGAAQAITVAFAPVLTRLYGPEAFGQWGVFIAALVVLTPLTALTYPIAIVLPKGDEEARALARLSLYTALGAAGVLTVLLILTGDRLLKVMGAETIGPLAFLLPAALFFEAGVQVGQQWLIRKNLFGVRARIAVVQSLVLNAAKAGVGLVKPAGASLIVLAALGKALHAAMLRAGSRRAAPEREGEDQAEGTSVPLGKLAGKYRDFPLYRAPQVLIWAVSDNLPVLMLAGFSGPALAGFYTIGKTVLGMPSQLIAKSVGDVFYPRISQASHGGEKLTGLTLKATGGLALAGLAPFLAVILFGPRLFGFVFGAEWVQAGVYARWLSPLFFFNFINKPAVAALPVLGIQKGFLVYEVLSTGGKLAAMLVGFRVFSSGTAGVALFALTGTLAYIGMILWVIGAMRKHDTVGGNLR